MRNICNFVIISHVDHGKSTLADRFLELTGTIPKEKMRPQYLDMMDLEREKGITIKMQPVRMCYTLKANPPDSPKQNRGSPTFVNKSRDYTLNLIDTPGHVDFSYEVSRSLAAVEGAILLVDAAKGIQAQTINNLELARRQNLKILAAVNKIDSPQARIKETKEELANLLNIPEDEIFEISAKDGTNVKEFLEAVIEKIPGPEISEEDLKKPLRALIFDSQYDFYKGVIAFVRVMEGSFLPGDKIYLIQAKTEGEAKEVGYFLPQRTPQKALRAGEIGYIATGIKEPGKVRVGDTIIIQNTKYKIQNTKIEALPGYQEPKSMIFASFYPENPDQFDLLKESLTKLRLNDPSLTFEPERKMSLGRGFRCGFLGSLHTEIVSERIYREYGLDLVISAPSVAFKILGKNNQELFVKSVTDWPEPSRINEIQELWVKLRVITPKNYLGRVVELLKNMEGKNLEMNYITAERLLLNYEAPLREIMVGFYDKLKSLSQGFASMDYQLSDWQPADLVKLEILVAGKKEEAFSQIVSRERAYEEGKRIVEKLKETLPPQLFSVVLQALVGGKIIARQTIRARGRDVIAPLYGGDYTRKRKLLERQKKGKKELKEKGEVRIPHRVFLEIFKSK